MAKNKSKKFKVKKKTYTTPLFREYGPFSEKTKGEGFFGQEADGQSYYDGAHS